jgi:hypothetical protein
MAKSASVTLIAVKLPKHLRGELPTFGVDTDIPSGATESERQRVSNEAPRVDAVLMKANRTQWKLLERLVHAAPKKRVPVPDLAALKRFLTKTKSVTAESEASIDDEALAAMWNDAHTTKGSRR